jgi:hypothetical protein
MRFRVNDGKSQPSYRLYASAVLELGSKQIIKRVDAAEAAIHGRLRDLQYDSDHQSSSGSGTAKIDVCDSRRGDLASAARLRERLYSHDRRRSSK